MIRPKVRRWTIKVPATTSNLGPGFDVLGLAVKLALRVKIETADAWSIENRGEGADELPTGRDHLFRRAAEARARSAKAKLPVLSVICDNEIPVARGLGSSAAVALAGVLAADAVLGISRTDDDVLAAALKFEGHSDNLAPALHGGGTASFVDGKEITVVRWKVPKAFQVGVVIPHYEVSTRAARKALPANVPFDDAVANVTRAVTMTQALVNGEWDSVYRAMRDRLHEPYRQKLMPGFPEIRKQVDKSKLKGVCLSGAGPTVLCLGPSERAVRQSANAVRKILRKHKVDADIKIPGVDRQGARVYGR